MSSRQFLALCVLALGALAPAAGAQDESPAVHLGWKPGPTPGALGALAKIDVPEGYVYLGKQDTIRLLELMGNPTAGNELATIAPIVEDEPWFLFFTFDDVGYVKDEDKDDLDADDLLDSIREGTKAANEVRRDKGWDELDIVGWEHEPSYNAATNNLEWAIRGESKGRPVLNHSIRLLGRKGVMSAELVTSPEQYDASVAAVGKLLAGFSFQPGNSYPEYSPGDKIAEYGLGALVTGGAAAVALKTGLLQKFWKLIVAAVVAVGAAIKRLFGRRAKRDGGASAPGAHG